MRARGKIAPPNAIQNARQPTMPRSAAAANGMVERQLVRSTVAAGPEALKRSKRQGVREDPVQNLAFELTFLVLVQRAHAHVPDPLSGHCCLQTSACKVEF
jgi:hypothetical protein